MNVNTRQIRRMRRFGSIVLTSAIATASLLSFGLGTSFAHSDPLPSCWSGAAEAPHTEMSNWWTVWNRTSVPLYGEMHMREGSSYSSVGITANDAPLAVDECLHTQQPTVFMATRYAWGRMCWHHNWWNLPTGFYTNRTAGGSYFSADTYEWKESPSGDLYVDVYTTPGNHPTLIKTDAC